MTSNGGDRADPLPNPKIYWADRTVGWSAGAPDGTATDDTFDRALIEASAIVPGMDVLDLAAGSGDPSVTIAEYLAGSGSVTALDLTYDMLAMAVGRRDKLKLDYFRIVSGDMAALPFPDKCFDAVTCRNGLMFPDDKLACVAEARRVLKPGAKGAWLVWSTIEDNPTFLRVRPETLCRITEFSEHESNGRELDEGERVAVEVLPVLGQSAAAVEPGDGAFDHPTPGLDDEALHPIGSLDDLGLEIGQDAGQGAVKDRPLIGAVGEQFPEKGKQTEQGRQQRETAVAILNVGGGDDAVQQQALRIDQNMPLLALDQLAGIEAVAVDASPPFSALFTL